MTRKKLPLICLTVLLAGLMFSVARANADNTVLTISDKNNSITLSLAEDKTMTFRLPEMFDFLDYDQQSTTVQGSGPQLLVIDQSGDKYITYEEFLASRS